MRIVIPIAEVLGVTLLLLLIFASAQYPQDETDSEITDTIGTDNESGAAKGSRDTRQGEKEPSVNNDDLTTTLPTDTTTTTPSTDTNTAIPSIEIGGHFRDYLSGPIENSFSLSKYDPVLLYAGKIENPGQVVNGKVKIRKWLLWGDTGEFSSVCHLQRIYNFGERALFLCLVSGNYIAYMEDGEADEFVISDAKQLKPAEDITYAIEARKHFPLFLIVPQRHLGAKISDEDYWKELTGKLEELHNNSAVTMSDPVNLMESDFCYSWDYRLDIKAKVNFVFKESQPKTGFGQKGSHLIAELLVWIIEPVTEHYKSLKIAQEDANTDVTDYSKLLTRRFQSKNIIPCLRHVHPSVELMSEVVFVEERDTTSIRTPHWRMQLKIHTDALVSTLDDISFTISSLQHAVLFKCFVGDVRVMVSYRDFNFIDEGQTDRNQINWKVSHMDDVRRAYLSLKLKHVYGHGTKFTGSAWTKSYQSGASRTDAVVISNPCISQEFALAVAGRVYVVEQFLSDYRSNVADVTLPGLDFDDTTDKEYSTITQHPKYYGVRDVAFTPTHFAILRDDSSVYLQPHSIYYQGFAYMTAISKFRLDAFVKRKWCSKSSYQKTSNMLIPGYSRLGVIMFIQIFPTEAHANVHLEKRKSACLSTSDDDVSVEFEDVLKKSVNETCIHQKDAVQHSNEQGLPVEDDWSGCKADEEDPMAATDVGDTDEMLKYVKDFEEFFPEFDPHFPREVVNPALHKISANKTHYNLALVYTVDETDIAGEKIENELKKNGLTVQKRSQDQGKTGGISLHAVEFTAEDKRFVFGADFNSDEVIWKSDNPDTSPPPTPVDSSSSPMSMIVAMLYTRNLAAKLYPTPHNESSEVVLDSDIHFPGSFFVRSKQYQPNVGSNKASYIAKLSTVSTALPVYALDLGDVVIFSSIEGRYARPMSYFTRQDIHKMLKETKHGTNPSDSRQLEKKDRKTKIADCNWPLSDFLMTEQGFVSVLRRRPEVAESGVPSSTPDPECRDPANATLEGQSILIGSIHTLDSFREVRPFAAEDNIFQMTTPDGEIVYGKFTTQSFYPISECAISSVERFKENPTEPNANEKSCIIQDPSETPLCVLPITKHCRPWEDEMDVPNCNASMSTNCVYVGQDGRVPRKDYPRKEIGAASILNVQFNSLLSGNLQLVAEEKLTEPPGNFLHISKSKADHICPFSDFRIEYIPFNYADIGFSTRITAFVSYYGILIPAEIDLLVEFDEEPGIQIVTTSSVSQQRDEVTITKTIDLEFTLTDQALRRMKEEKLVRTDIRETINLDRELHSVFSITIRPSIVNAKCNKEDFYTTIQYNIGCYPFNKLRLLAEATPVRKKDLEKDGWRRSGDVLEVPRAHVWHKQRERFNCKGDKNSNTKCKIPFAYLYGDQIYDLSWRDPFVPRFEQMISSRARKVRGNIVVYNMLSNATLMNITMLEARCYNNGSIPKDKVKDKSWHDRLQASTSAIGLQSFEREDIYQYYSDCFEVSELPRESPDKLDSQHYRLINLTNQNTIRFDETKPHIRTKNRNQIYILRAAVLNTYFNRFTYCQLMDTVFLLRITGIPAPREALNVIDFIGILSVLAFFFVSVYFVFYKFYTWKLDIPAIPGTEEDPELTDGIPGETEFGQVESDHMMKRLAVKVHAIAKWRRKVKQRSERPNSASKVSVSSKAAANH